MKCRECDIEIDLSSGTLDFSLRQHYRKFHEFFLERCNCMRNRFIGLHSTDKYANKSSNTSTVVHSYIDYNDFINSDNNKIDNINNNGHIDNNNHNTDKK